MWWLKLGVCMTYDLFDMTVGRLLFVVPFASEIVGCILCYCMFGRDGFFYGLEGLDFTEQLDGFIPTATIIALANRPKGELAHA